MPQAQAPAPPSPKAERTQGTCRRQAVRFLSWLHRPALQHAAPSGRDEASGVQYRPTART